MIDHIFFENSYLFWPVVILGAILFGLFIWKEWMLKLDISLLIKVFVAFILIFSLAMIALKPATMRTNKEAVVLLTKGFSQNRLDSLKAKHKNLKQILYQENVPFEETLDLFGTIFILGDGVATYDFWQFNNRPATYLGSPMPKGITKLKYPLENVIGENLEINGSYNNATKGHSLVLQDSYGLAIDSVALLTDSLQNFKLKAALKATGKFVFKIVEKDETGIRVSQELLPFKVVPKTTFKILFINSYPVFETKYLKNFLSEMAHEVVLRTKLTKNRYKFEYFNYSNVPIINLDSITLSRFDLVIIDDMSYKSASKRQKTAINNAIENDGLGVFVQPNYNLFSQSNKEFDFRFEKDGKTKLRLTEYGKIAFDKFPFRFKNRNRFEGIHSSNGHNYTAYKRFKKGRVGTSVIHNTYQLQLKGKTEAYKRFWSDIVNRLAKQKESEVDWKINTNISIIHQPFKFELGISKSNNNVTLFNDRQLALKQHISGSNLWSGTNFPSQQGWNQIRHGNEALDFYVFDTLAWQSLRTSNQHKMNNLYFLSSQHNAKRQRVRKTIPLFWFFVVFLFCFGYLWVHPKFYG